MNFLSKIFLIICVCSFLKADSNYYEEAGSYFNIDPRLLWSVAKVESKHNPYAISVNENGTEDIGIMQINSVHLPFLRKHGISKKDLFEPRTNIFVGTWVLHNCFKKYGNSINAITCYNGRIKDNPYAEKVLKAFYDAEKNHNNKTN